MALGLVKRGLTADIPLVIGPETPDASGAAAMIDADSLPPADVAGAGRLAVDRLRGDNR